MSLSFRILSGSLFLVLLLAGCAPVGGPTSTPATLSPVALTPYQSATATIIPPAPPAGTPTPLPSPTPTPRTHRVAPGEDMGGIAFRYRITLAALMAANPNVNPNTMSVGTVLVIPASAGPAETSAAPSPTPIPLDLQPVRCDQGQDGGVWCFLLAHNTQTFSLENLSAVIRMQDQSGGSVRSQTAYAPLDLLAPGASLALAAFFPGPASLPVQASAEMLSAIPIPTGDSRYLAAGIQNQQVEMLEGGLAARLTGQVQLKDPQKSARQVWVAAVAYDAAGQVVGVRRWENKSPLGAGQQLAFDFFVYSAGPAITRVELLVQARP